MVHAFKEIISRLNWRSLVVAMFFIFLSIIFNSSHPNRSCLIFIFLFTASSIIWGLLWLISTRPSLKQIILISCLLRLCFLPVEPIWDDDVFRFLWDGWMTLQTGTPYVHVPFNYFGGTGMPAEVENWLDQINYPELPTIYAPGIQLYFMVSALLPSSLITWKLIILAHDIATIVLLARLSCNKTALLYASCPLLIIEAAWHAHFESIGAFWFVLAIWILKQEKTPPHKRNLLAATALALALSIKISAILVLPFFFKRLPFKYFFLMPALAILTGLPFIIPTIHQLQLPHELSYENISYTMGKLQSFTTFARSWEFNSAFYAILKNLIGQTSAKVVGLLLFGSGALFLLVKSYQQKLFPSPGATTWVAALTLLFSPVINPWYAIWLLPLATLDPKIWQWFLFTFLPLSYMHGLFLPNSNLDPFQHPIWLRPLEFALILVPMLLYLKSTLQTDNNE